MTTQDKPAVGPLSAGDLPLLVKGDLLRRQNGTVATVVTANPEAFRTEHGLNSKGMARNFAFIGRPGPDGWIPWSGGENPVPGQEVEVRYRSFDCVREPPFIRHHGSEGPANRYYWANDGSSGDIIAFRLAPTAPADVSTKPLETNTSAEHVKETAKNEHVTAPVEAGGWDEAKLIAYEDAHAVAVEMGYPSLTEALEHLAALRPQPSGETLQSLAQAFEDAMEGSHGAWAVSGDEGPLSATTVADKIQADTDAKLTDCPSGETREAVLKGVGKINGDGWKDTTTEGEIVFVWNAEKPAPYAPGQYPRVGNEGWSASTSQYDFTPATADDVPAIIALLSARPAPVASSDQPEQGALEVVAWPVVTDQWTETYCELTGRDPDGKQVTFVDGATVTTFRDMAKREIEAMLCAAPKAAVRAIAALTPPAEPVSRPAEEGEREAVARIIDPSAFLFAPDELPKGSRAQYDAFDKADRIIALLRPAAPDAGGGDTLKQAAIVAKNMADNASYNINQAGVTQENATYDRAFVEIYNVLDRALQPGGER